MSSASFRKNRVFGPGRRLAAPEGPKIAGGASRWREGKSQSNSRPSEGGRVLRFLGRPKGLQEVRCVAAGFSRLVAIGFLGPGGAWGSLGGSRESRRAPETPQEPQGAPGAAQK